MMTTKSDKVFFYLLFVLVVTRVITAPVPDGVWSGIVVSYPVVWIALLFLTVNTLVRSIQDQLSWTEFLARTGLIMTLLGLFSTLWGTPLSAFDPWNHFRLTKRVPIVDGRNAYPAFHLLLQSLTEVTSERMIHWLTTMGLLFAYVGVAGATILAKRLPVSRPVGQAGVVATLPAISLGFVSRPFTMAWVILIFGLWLVFSIDLNGWNLLAVGLITLAPVVHPQLIPPIILMLGLLIGTRFISDLDVIKYWLSKRSHSRSYVSRSQLILLAGIVFVAYMLWATTAGSRILEQTLFVYRTGGGTSAAAAATSGSGVFSFLTSFRAFVEFTSRLWYILLLLFVIGIGGLLYTLKLSIPKEYLIGTAAGFVTGIGFLGLFIGTSALGIQRITYALPVIIIPAVIMAHRAVGRQRMIVAGMALLCFTAGAMTIYPADVFGQAGKGATEQQAVGVEWSAEYINENTTDIVGSSSTFWMLKGFVIDDRLFDLQYQPPRVRKGQRFAWQNTGDRRVTVITDTDIASVDQYTDETGNYNVERELNITIIRGNVIYRSGDTRIIYE